MSNFKSTVSIDRIKELLNYDPATGVFTWRVFRTNKTKAGDAAGTVATFGHVQLRVDRYAILAHRAAWAMIHGDWPTMDIDHRNRIPNDNRIDNLRHVPRSCNLQNQMAAHKDSKSGFLGVTKNGNKWEANIWTSGKNVYIGLFNSPEDASAAYVAKKRQVHVGCMI